LTLAHADAAPDARAFGFPNIIGGSPALREAVKLAGSVAAARRTTVLLIGETGTGKELFSRGIHYASSAANEPFVAINCAAIPEALLESELFGHEKGAFSGAYARKQGLLELAGHGTLFLDEVHHLPRTLQPKLLRALESRRVRRVGGLEEFSIECRIIAAASPHLEQVVASGEFREDLFYRLNVIPVQLPPLRERKEDIPLLVHHFLARFAAERNTSDAAGRSAKAPERLPGITVSQEAMRRLMAYHWPGNVRQLENALERAVAFTAGRSQIDEADLPAEVQQARETPTPATISLPEDGIDLDAFIAGIERDLIQRSLERTGGNKGQAARLLNLKRTTLVEKLKRLERP